MLKNKNIVLGITGGIAAYKSCDVISKLRKKGANIDVIMTKSAQEFITPLTIQTISSNKVYTDMFEKLDEWKVEHIELAKKADIFLIVPATANFIGKLANGIADDMLTTTAMATKKDIIIAPAMNTNMYENPIVASNMDKLKELGVKFIEAQEGLLACGDIGKGKLADVDDIVDFVEEYFANQKYEQDLKDIDIIVTAGPTCESIDPVRYITNRSSGKMGYAIAKAGVSRGARVSLVTGRTNEKIPKGLKEVIHIESADELYRTMMDKVKENKVIIQSSAVADYKPATYSDSKIKKKDGDMSIPLVRNKDVALEIGKQKGDKILVGFAAETDDIIENAKKKIEKKNLDFIVANNLKEDGAGFRGDTNIVKIIDKDGNISQLEKMSKLDVAHKIIDRIVLELKR